MAKVKDISGNAYNNLVVKKTRWKRQVGSISVGV